ncbi:hypothetical protein KY290_025149 [Solanum tuberosum]|uniref:Uncharacterized protein n=1 Tax=Solanum tuberosum TaxID=4113 RepID=A0ABQ7USY4_SOLTU|nr:hypothetical protein KY290_025149 [Solanum tuberosum]
MRPPVSADEDEDLASSGDYGTTDSYSFDGGYVYFLSFGLRPPTGAIACRLRALSQRLPSNPSTDHSPTYPETNDLEAEPAPLMIIAKSH